MISDELGSNVPGLKAYRQAFLTIRDQLTDNQFRLLQIHYAAPDHTIKPRVLAERIGYPNYSAVNLQYGLLAKRVCNVLGLQLRFHIQALVVYVQPDSDKGDSPRWIMRPQVAQALQDMGWVAEPTSRPFEDVSDKGLKEDQVHQTICSLLPQERRRLYLEMLVETIDYANSCGRAKWGVYYTPSKVRLLVGNLIVFTVEKGRVWLALDKESIEASDEVERFLLRVNEWLWDVDDYPTYSQVPSRNGYYTLSDNHLDIWPVIKDLHFNFLSKVAQKYRKLRTTSQARHSSVLLSYLQSETSRLVPTPIYEQTDKGSAFTSPDEIMDGVAFYEGGKQRITVNAYERNPEARAACIAYYGAFCQVCGFNFRERYGEIGRDVIHVHHLKPLSDIGEEYKIDPIHDLITVCPNCHTIIHKRNPPYTVEEIKEFLKLTDETDN